MTATDAASGPLEPLPFPVYEAAVRVCGETIFWKSTMKRLFRRAGVAEAAWVRYEELSKFKIARTLQVL